MNKLLSKRIIPFTEFCLRGSGQVLFQNHPVSGLLFLIAIFVASLNSGIAASISLVISTFIGCYLRPHSSALRNGSYGYDGLLVGALIGTFYGNHTYYLSLLIIAPILVVLLKINTQKFFSKLKLPQLTFPFILISWLLFLLFPVEFKVSTSVPSIQELSLHSVSQIFLVGNYWSTGLILTGLLVNSRKSFGWSIVASMSPVWVNDLFNFQVYGFSAILTAVALGDIFGSKKPLRVLVAIFITIMLQVGINELLMKAGVPGLTSPFVLVTWMFLYFKK